MRRLARLFLQLAFLMALPSLAFAQCVGNQGIPFNCAPGSAIGSGDLFLGGQGTNTVKFTAAQVAQFAAAAGQPGVFSTLTVTGGGTLSGSFSGNFTFSGNVTFSGSATFAGGLALSSITLSNSTITLINSLFAGLPAVTSANAGQLAFVTDCQNGNQGGGSGTGCLYVVNDAGTWTAIPSPSNLTITVGGQALFPSGSTLNQGNGNRIQLATSGTPGIAGQCAQFDANLNIVPSGAGCGGGGGGSGTVSSGLANQLGYYAANGTTISGLAIVNSGVPSYSSGGVLSVTTTLPSGLAIPGATISNPTITGTATVAAATFSGALTTAASASGGAAFNIPQGTAPTSPVNGNIWGTSAGLFDRYNGATVGPFIGLAQLSASAPIVDTSGVFSCPTCATTTNGGLLTATAPMAISAAGVISINEQTVALVYWWNASTPVTADSNPIYWPFVGGHITSVKAFTGGTSSPGYTIAVSVNGVNVTGCNAIAITSANTLNSPSTTTCTSTAVTQYQPVTVTTSSVNGTPFSSLVEVFGTRSAL